MRVALGWLPCMALARATSANESRATTASLPAGVLWGVGQLLLSSVINIPRKARGPNCGDGAEPAVEISGAVPGVPVRRFPAVLLALLLSGDVGVGQAQSARVPVSSIDDGFSGRGPLGVGRREG